MRTLKKIIRIIALVMLIILASAGVGIFGFLPTHRERYMNKQITTEQVDKKEEESSEEEEVK